MKKNLIIICIDGCRNDRAIKSKIYNNYLPGTIFCSQSITYAPYTNSSLHAAFSGSNGNRNGCYSYWHSLKFQNDSFKTITRYLKDENYFTLADIHSKLAIPLNDFEKYETYDENNSDLISRHGELLDLMKSKYDSGKNFFLYLHYEKIHTGIMNSVLKVFSNYSQEYFDDKKNNAKRYDDLFLTSEIYLKSLLDRISDLKLNENSLIVILSDHGVSLGEKIGEKAYGAFCYDYTIKTFLTLISSEFNNNTINQQVRHIDLLPTVLDYLKIQLDQNFSKIDGQSLLPLFNNKKIPEEIAYTETANPLNEKAPPKVPNTKSVRTSDWKLIFNEYDNTKELYNLQNDPNEEINLIGKDLPIEEKLWAQLQKHNLLSV